VRRIVPGGKATSVFGRRSFLAGLGSIVLATATSASEDPGQRKDPIQRPIKLGWQIPWATQGQVVMAMRHTNIPDLVGIRVEYPGFAYGAPLNLAALAGEVDVILTADQPALILLSRSDAFSIVARLMYNRTCLYVPPNSQIKAVAQLSGKTVMGPTGAAAERVALEAIEQAGVDLDSLRLGNMDMAQQLSLLRRSTTSDRWSGIDALYGFDPIVAAFEANNSARMLQCGKVLSLVLASKEMITSRLEELRRFLQGLQLSWFYYARHPEEANVWFAEEARLDVSSSSLDKAAEIEPNRWAQTISDIRLNLSAGDIDSLDSVVSFLQRRGTLPYQLDFRSRINIEVLDSALKDSRWLEASARAIRVQEDHNNAPR
jgi:ABC-type nitrate/sulfonate/bicarbonate transport system substrate-binding protein